MQQTNKKGTMVSVEISHRIGILKSAGIAADVHDIVSNNRQHAKQKLTSPSSHWAPGGTRIYRDVEQKFAGDAVDLCLHLTNWDVEKCVDQVRFAHPWVQKKGFYTARARLANAMECGRDKAIELMENAIIADQFGDWGVVPFSDFQEMFPRSGLSARITAKKERRLLLRKLMDPFGQWAGVTAYSLSHSNVAIYIDEFRFPGFEQCPLITPDAVDAWPGNSIFLAPRLTDAGAASYAGLAPTFCLVDTGSPAWNGNFPQSEITYVSSMDDIADALHVISGDTAVFWLNSESIQRLPSARSAIVQSRIGLAEAFLSLMQAGRTSIDYLNSCCLLSSSGRGRLTREIELLGQQLGGPIVARKRQFESEGWTYFIRQNCVWKTKPGSDEGDRQVTNFVVEPSEDVLVCDKVVSHLVRVHFDEGEMMPILIPVALIKDSGAYLSFLRDATIRYGKPRPAVMLEREKQMLPTIFDALYLGAPSMSNVGRGKSLIPASATVLRLAGSLTGKNFVAPSTERRFLSEKLVREVIRLSGVSRTNDFGRGLRGIHGSDVECVTGEGGEKGWSIPPDPKIKPETKQKEKN